MFYKTLNFINLIILSLFDNNFPKISIIIPIFNNNSEYLKQSLDSLKYQTLKNLEIICVNGRSIDNNNLKIIMKYLYDNRFIIINQNNICYEDSINEGLKFVSGKYIGIIELNYFIENNIFENLYKFTYNNTVDIVRYNYHLNEKRIFFQFRIIKSLYNKIFNPIKYKNNFLILPSILNGIYKKDLLIKNKFKFFLNTSFHQNLLFSFKNFYKKNIILYSNNSIISNKNKNTKFSNKQFFEIEKYFKKPSFNDIFLIQIKFQFF